MSKSIREILSELYSRPISQVTVETTDKLKRGSLFSCLQKIQKNYYATYYIGCDFYDTTKTPHHYIYSPTISLVEGGD